MKIKETIIRGEWIKNNGGNNGRRRRRSEKEMKEGRKEQQKRSEIRGDKRWIEKGR